MYVYFFEYNKIMHYETYSFHTQQGTSEFLNRFNYLKRHFITFLQDFITLDLKMYFRVLCIFLSMQDCSFDYNQYLES